MTSWTFSFLPLRDGPALRWGRWGAEARHGHVLLLPGRVEFIEKYTDVAAAWASRGYQALCLDWRGQGGSGREVPDAPGKGHIDSFGTYLADLACFWESVLQGVDPILLMAHSTGAHLALRFLGESPEKTRTVRRVIVTAPLVRVQTDRVPYPLARCVATLMASLAPTAYAVGQGPFSEREGVFAGNPLTADPEQFARWTTLRVDHPDLTIGGATWGWVNAAMRSEEKLRAALPKVTPPVLAVLTPADPLIDGASQRILPDRLPRCTTLSLPESRHEVLMESPPIRRQVWAAVDSFRI